MKSISFTFSQHCNTEKLRYSVTFINKKYSCFYKCGQINKPEVASFIKRLYFAMKQLFWPYRQKTFP